jgi:hypothetical protein
MTAPTTQQRSLFDHAERPEIVVEPDNLPRLEVEVVRSKRRKKTSEAHLVGSVLNIKIPNAMTKTEEAEIVKYFVDKFELKYGAKRIDLDERAAKLAQRYGLERPLIIRWVSNQNQRWGSCSPEDKVVRLSDKLVPFPDWVIDYVIVHELAHLTYAGHDKDFWALVNRYAKTERARGYLIAMAHAEQA